MILRMECGSSRSGRLSEGCVRCIEGAKMVLFVTGRCSHGCYYCPVSFDRKGKDTVFANERKVSSWDEIFEEADSMDAEGTGITGGDPLECMDRTLRAIRTLKERYGPGHHIHLYTATIDPEKVRMLEEAGLDEIRFHPPTGMWGRMDETRLSEIVSSSGMDVGIEVPALPDMREGLDALLSYAERIGIRFANLNELEFSESNWDMMAAHGYGLAEGLSAAVEGSRGLAMEMMRRHRRLSIHFCSSPFKDGVQLRRRLMRKALRCARPFDAVTEDGTVVMGAVYGPEDDVRRALLSAGMPEDMMAYNRDLNRMETDPSALEGIASDIGYKCCIVEEYPTADRLEVERRPL